MARNGTISNKEGENLGRAFQGWLPHAFHVGHRLKLINVAYNSTTATWDPSLSIATSSSPLTLSTYADHGFILYTTCASTDGSNSVEPVYVKSVMTGAAGVGGRARFHMYTNVALGGWSNALKAHAEYGASGSTAGLGSAFCAETVLSAGTSSGTYTALEAELVFGTTGVTGTKTSFLYCNTDGTAKTAFDTNGVFLHIGAGITAAAGKFVSADYQSLKCYFSDGSTTRYMVLSQTENGLGLGSSGTAMTTTFDGTKPFSLYTTCASTSGTSHEPFLVSTTLTGAGQTGGRGRFYLSAEAAQGGWTNALKAEVAYGASGSTSGLGSAFCAEIALSAGTTSGSYAPLETELTLASGGSTGTATSFLYGNVSGTGVATLNTNAYLFQLGAGVTIGTKATASIVSTRADGAATHSVKILVGSTTLYLLATTDGPED